MKRWFRSLFMSRERLRADCSRLEHTFAPIRRWATIQTPAGTSGSYEIRGWWTRCVVCGAWSIDGEHTTRRWWQLFHIH